MALDLSGVQYEAFNLIEITFPSGTWRYCTTTGFVNYGGFNWLSVDDVQGQILELAISGDNIDTLQSADLTLGHTDTLLGYVKLNQALWSSVKIYDAQRDLSSFAVSVEATYRQFYIQELVSSTLYRDFKFLLGKAQAQADRITYSSASRNPLHGSTDFAFDKISGVQSGTIYSGSNGGGSSGGTGGGGGYNQDSAWV